MKIPCDGFLIQGELIVDESAMTGETNTAKKETLSKSQENKNTTPIVLSGTVILDGEAKILTLLVGKVSCVGKICVPIEEPEETIMQRKISDFSIYFGKFSVAITFLLFLYIGVGFFIERFAESDFKKEVHIAAFLKIIISLVSFFNFDYYKFFK